jgi:hypothetical protein
MAKPPMYPRFHLFRSLEVLSNGCKGATKNIKLKGEKR